MKPEDKLAIGIALITIAIIGYIIGFVGDAHGMEFDERTPLHIGASAVIAGGTNLALTQTEMTRTSRLVLSGATCWAVGVAKETLIDDATSSSDLAANALGCLIGLALTESLFVTADEDSVAIHGRW